jgi:hypothetical protein
MAMGVATWDASGNVGIEASGARKVPGSLVQLTAASTSAQ